MKPLRIFYTTGDCGCSGSSGFSTPGGSTPTLPANKTVVCDDRYFTLLGGPAGKLMMVPVGSNCQMFLEPSVAGTIGFVFVDAMGRAYIEPQPKMNLPFINPAVSGSVPATGNFKHLIVGSGADPSNWQMMTAPTAGSWMLQANGGAFALVDVGQIPGIAEIGASATFVTKAQVIGVVETAPGSGVYVARKITPQNERVMVGDTVSPQGWRAIDPTEYLKHNKCKFTEGNLGEFHHIDSGGNQIPLGMAAQPLAGAGSDALGVVYSYTDFKFYRRPVPTYNSNTVNSVASFTGHPADYTALPGGHGLSGSLQINYPTVLVTAQLALGADENMDFAIYRDGVQKQTYTFGSPETVALSYVDKNVPIGAHSWEIRRKKSDGPGTGSGSFRSSTVTVITLPN